MKKDELVGEMESGNDIIHNTTEYFCDKIRLKQIHLKVKLIWNQIWSFPVAWKIF